VVKRPLRKGRFGYVQAPHPKATEITNPQLERLRQRFEKGDRLAALEALDLYARVTNPVFWAVQEFAKIFLDWQRYKYQTLDEAFGAKRRKNLAARQRELLRCPVVKLVAIHYRKGEAINDALFQKIGEMIAKDGKYVKRLYSEPRSSARRKWLGLPLRQKL
jgi:hypothetical protein